MAWTQNPKAYRDEAPYPLFIYITVTLNSAVIQSYYLYFRAIFPLFITTYYHFTTKIID